MSHTISAALKNLILEKASQGKLSHRSGETYVFVHNKINTDTEPSCQSVKLNDQCEVIDEISNISVSQKDVNHLMTRRQLLQEIPLTSKILYDSTYNS